MGGGKGDGGPFFCFVFGCVSAKEQASKQATLACPLPRGTGGKIAPGSLISHKASQKGSGDLLLSRPHVLTSRQEHVLFEWSSGGRAQPWDSGLNHIFGIRDSGFARDSTSSGSRVLLSGFHK